MISCKEFEQVLPEMVDGESVGAEAQAHGRSCPTCSVLLRDLQAIVSEARQMAASEEPSPRVWIGVRQALEAEGIIRKARREHRLLDFFAMPRWRPVWAPLAVAAALIVGVFLYRSGGPTPATHDVAAVATPEVAALDAEDLQLLNTITAHAPAMRAAYETNLRDVNAYIRDANDSVRKDPNDEAARNHQIEAYDQKAMLYDMAMDRSLR
jgi:hypothetical protein